MKRYEVIRIELDMGDLKGLNGLSSVGFHVVGIVQEQHPYHVTAKGDAVLANYALMEREITE